MDCHTGVRQERKHAVLWGFKSISCKTLNIKCLVRTETLRLNQNNITLITQKNIK